VNLFVDTSVWSLALRRDAPPPVPEMTVLARALESGDAVFTTGLIVQELLQGFTGPRGRSRDRIVSHFTLLPWIVPDRDDHIRAAEVRNTCRRRGIQVGTIDALLAQLCIRHDLVMLTCDEDFARMARVVPLTVWG
jgi:predicted nucleic acid-binding protein